MALNILVSQRNGSDSMFESHYLKPFIVSLGITTILISGMGLSLRGMTGTGAANDAAEISFDLTDDSESSVEVAEQIPKPEEKVAPVEAVPESVAPKPQPQSQTIQEDVKPDDSEQTKTIDANTNTPEPRREWTVPKAIESEATGGEQAVVAHEKQSKPKEQPIGKDITLDPNANGNGRTESADLSFLSDLAWSLLTPGQQELLRQPEINPSAYLRRVQEQGAASSVTGTVTVKVNFGEDGHVIVAQNTPRIVVDGVPPDVMEEALRIVKTSGSIVNNSGRIQTLTIPVVMGQ